MKYYVTINKSDFIRWARENATSFRTNDDYDGVIGMTLRMEGDLKIACIYPPKLEEIEVVERLVDSPIEKKRKK